MSTGIYQLTSQVGLLNFGVDNLILRDGEDVLGQDDEVRQIAGA